MIAGAEPIIAIDILDNKLELSKQFGATHTVNSSQVDPVMAIQDLTDGQGVHYAFEAIGLVSDPFKQSILCTRKRGITVYVGHAPERVVLGSTSHVCLVFIKQVNLNWTNW